MAWAGSWLLQGSQHGSQPPSLHAPLALKPLAQQRSIVSPTCITKP